MTRNGHPKSRPLAFESLERRELLSADVRMVSLRLAPPASEPLPVGRPVAFALTVSNGGDRAFGCGQRRDRRDPVSRHSARQGHRDPHTATQAGRIHNASLWRLVAGVDWPIRRAGNDSRRGTCGRPRNANNSKGVAVQVGWPDFEVVSAPRIAATTPAIAVPSRVALGDLTLVGRETQIQVEVRNNRAGPYQSYVEVTVTRVGSSQPEWVGSVQFDLAHGQTLRAIAENKNPRDRFPRYWRPRHAGSYTISAVADPPLAGKPLGAILEGNDTNGDSPDPAQHWGNNAKFRTVYSHPEVPAPSGQPIDWLRSMLTPDQSGGTGRLVRSYFRANHTSPPTLAAVGDKPLPALAYLEWSSSSYDNALAVIAFATSQAVGDMQRARWILHQLRTLQNLNAHQPAQAADGAFPFTWDAALPRRFVGDAKRTVGNNAWIVLAASWFTVRSHDGTFLAMAEKTADWMLTFQDAQTGLLRGGLDAEGNPLAFTATEHNIDAVAALESLAALVPAKRDAYLQAADQIRQGIAANLWIESEGRFRRGLNDDYPVSDVQSWGVLALGPTGPNGEDYRRALSWTEEHCKFRDQYFAGIDFNAPNDRTDTVSPEQTESLALAFNRINRADQYQLYHGQAKRLKNANGGVRYTSRPGDMDESGVKTVTLDSAGSAAWWLFANQRLNPFVPRGA